jgi:alanyl-tRNA synthetase
VIPYDDPTLLFTNAGMNQFKDVFTGKRKPDHPRAASSQKCIRAGGKHNDLDNVGYTARHHTFFEMLGNFSFGDYFKEEAIAWAWEWVTQTLGLSKDRLYATVYETDDEAFDLWAKIAPELSDGRIMRFGEKDNYWSMGNVGPCGPCSELHFDRGERFGTGPEHVVNGETDRYVEIWNLVFMQFDQLGDGKVEPLPKPSVDTGAGLERLAAIMQDVDTNYDIDLFQALIAAVSDLTSTKYEGEAVVSHRVIADHIRALSFAIADGAGISNEGQGYVLRRILRRAARHGHLLGRQEPFIYRLVPVLADQMGQAFPELNEKQSHIESVIKAEEESFARTLNTGLELFEKIASKLKKKGDKVVPGEEVFRLYDTYGFPVDLTEIIANERGLGIDQAGFEKAMDRQKEQSRAGAAFGAETDQELQAFIGQLERSGLTDLAPTEFVRGTDLSLAAEILMVASDGDQTAVVLDRSPYYVEAGGQISDVGSIYSDSVTIDVDRLMNHQGYYIHIGKVTSGSTDELRPGVKVTAEVDALRRWDIMRNHTATHLTHTALRRVLGDHVRQSGSYVGPDRLRFDFSHHQPMTPKEIAEVERRVNERILQAAEVRTEIMDIDAARESGAIALFGEKYAEKVRVVSIDDFSKELCGGTHVTNTAQIGPFFVTLETGIASGVRRIEAITGREAVKHMLDLKQFRHEVSEVVGRPESEALDAVRENREQLSALNKELKKVKAEMFSGGARSVGQEEKVGKLTLAYNDFGETDRDTMSGWVDSQKEKNQPVLALAIGQVNGKRTFIGAASKSAIKEHGVHVGNVAKETLPPLGGRGGGKPHFAQGGFGDQATIDDLVKAVRNVIDKG